MTNQEIIVLDYTQGCDTDIVTFTHVMNEDEDEVYSYSNKNVIVSLTRDTYDKMYNYYIELGYEIYYRVYQ